MSRKSLQKISSILSAIFIVFIIISWNFNLTFNNSKKDRNSNILYQNFQLQEINYSNEVTFLTGIKNGFLMHTKAIKVALYNAIDNFKEDTLNSSLVKIIAYILYFFKYFIFFIFALVANIFIVSYLILTSGARFDYILGVIISLEFVYMYIFIMGYLSEISDKKIEIKTTRRKGIIRE